MPRLKFIWDKEEEKEEEKPGWLNRTRGIGELPELPISTKLKFTSDVGLGIGAKATGGISLPEYKPLIEGLPKSLPSDKPIIEGLPISKPEEKLEPTWGDVVKHSLKSGLGQFQASLVNLIRLIDMGVTKLTDPINKIIPIDPEKVKAFKEKYGVDPNMNITDMLTKIVEESEKIAVKSQEQAESKQWLKKLVGTGLKATPQIVGAAVMGAGMPVVGGLATTKPIAEIITRVTQMIPFGLSAMGGQARQIEKEYEVLGKEAPYYATVIGGALSGVGEMATELPVFMGVARLLKTGGKELIEEGAKTLVRKYGKLGIEYIKNIALQSWQEAEMVLIEKAAKQSIGLPQDWSIEPLVREMGVNAYGGMAMALVLGGLGGGVAGSAIVANKTGKAVDDFIQNKGDIKETLRVIAEAQGIIPREPEAVVMGYEEKEKKPIPAFKDIKNWNTKIDGKLVKDSWVNMNGEEMVSLNEPGNETSVHKYNDLKAEVKPPTKIELPEKQTILTTLAEAKEILKVDPKKPSIPKDMLAKEMVAKKVSLADIEAVRGEKIDVTKPKDIIIALRDIKAVKKEVTDFYTQATAGKAVEGEVTEKTISEAVNIIRKIPENIMDGWFRNRDKGYKQKLYNVINSNPDIKNAGLKVMHYQYEAFTGTKIPYNEFLNKEITLYRGKPSGEDIFISYTMDKDIAEKFGEVQEIKIKPKDTLGSYQTTAETEVLVTTPTTEQPSAIAPVTEKATGEVSEIEEPTPEEISKAFPIVKPTAKPAPERTYIMNKDLTQPQRIEGNKLIGQIHKVVNQKGLTGVKFTDLKRKYGFSPHLATATKRMTIPQLQAVLQAVQKARPKIVNYKHVITPKTERKIQSLKDNLIDKLQMTEETYTAILKSEGVYKEPKYVDSKNFITETQGKDIIYRLIGESNILRETLPYEKAVKENPVIQKLIDKEKAIIGKYRDRGLKDPKELNSARVIFQKMEEITGAPIYHIYQSLIDISLENKEKAAVFLHDFKEYKDIIKDEKAIKRVADYITSKSNLKNKPEYPKKITEQEIKMAKKIEGVLKDYQVKARTEKFLEDIEFPQKIPQYEQYKKEIDKAKDIYEGKGYDDLVEYMKTQEWGIIRNGYDPLQVVSNEIRMWKPKPQTFGKSHIKVRTDIKYHEQDKNILERLFSYKKQMDNLVDMRPKVRAFITLIDENIDKFHNPQRIKKGVEIFLRELKGYNRPEGLVERELNRAYAQAMQVIILPSPVMFARNILQPIAFGFDKTAEIDPRNKKLTADEIDYMNTYVSQMQAMKIDWFMVGEKPYFGRLGAGLMKLVNKVGIYPYSDQSNRHRTFWAKINQVHRAFADIDKNSTEKQLSKAMGQAKFNDMERTERIMALEILAKDGEEAMARYMARVFTADTQFQYNRAERSFAEMGRGKWLTNLMLFPRSYNELLLKQLKHFKEGTPGQKARAFKVLISIIVGGILVGEGYKKVTGRRENPYSPLTLLAYEPGGLAIGTVEAISDVYSNTMLAVGGNERAIAALTTAIPRLADMWIPFYSYTIRGYEAATNQKNVDVRALRRIRELLDKEYKTRGDAYEIERNAMQKLQYFIAGAGVDTGIREREAEIAKEPLKITIPKGGKLIFTKPKLNIKSTKLKFNF